MNKKLQEYIKKVAKAEAKAHLQHIDDHFLSHNYFTPAPTTEQELNVAFKRMLETEEELWGHRWEDIEDMIPELLEEHEDRVVVKKDAKVLMAKVYNQDILTGLARHLGLNK